MDHKELLEIKRIYEETAQETIKGNIKHLMTINKVKHATMAEILGISQHTAYSYTNAANKGKSDLYNLLILANYFNIHVKELLK